MPAAKEKSINRDIKEVFSTPKGKRVLRAMMLNNRVFETTLDPDPLRMAYDEGRRSVVLDILMVFRGNIDPEEFAADNRSATIDSIGSVPRHDPLDS